MTENKETKLDELIKEQENLILIERHAGNVVKEELHKGIIIGLRIANIELIQPEIILRPISFLDGDEFFEILKLMFPEGYSDKHRSKCADVIVERVKKNFRPNALIEEDKFCGIPMTSDNVEAKLKQYGYVKANL